MTPNGYAIKMSQTPQL